VVAVVAEKFEGIVEAVPFVQLVVRKLVSTDQKVDHVDNEDNDTNGDNDVILLIAKPLLTFILPFGK